MDRVHSQSELIQELELWFIFSLFWYRLSNTNLAKGTCNRQLLGNNKCTRYISISFTVLGLFLKFQVDSLANTALWWNNWVNMLEKSSTAGFVELYYKKDTKSRKDD